MKLPKDMENHFNEETKDHYPASGLIEFSYGEPSDMRSDTLMFKPEVGMMIVFPSWLKHGSMYNENNSLNRIVISMNTIRK